MVNIIARNKRATYEYFIIDKYECGIVLQGTEVKSIRFGKVSLQDSYCRIINNELFVINMHISPYDHGNIFNHEVKRDRKLLARKSEIRKISSRVSQEGLTLIPLALYFVGSLAKLEIALCRGKKLYDKREDLRKVTIKRDLDNVRKSQVKRK